MTIARKVSKSIVIPSYEQNKKAKYDKLFYPIDVDKLISKPALSKDHW